MSKKKSNFYAVKIGRTPGVYSSWDDCRKQVEGFSGCKYRGFQTKKQAEDYLNDIDMSEAKSDNANRADVTVYVDGSYDANTRVYGYGCVVIQNDGDIKKFNGAGNNPTSAELRNVTGEMLGAMCAVRYAIKNGYKSVEICYDYQGIECWVSGDWQAKTDLTLKYARAMNEWSKDIDIYFRKVAAHTNIEYNELADQLAKQAVFNFNHAQFDLEG